MAGSQAMVEGTEQKVPLGRGFTEQTGVFKSRWFGPAKATLFTHRVLRLSFLPSSSDFLMRITDSSLGLLGFNILMVDVFLLFLPFLQ